MPKPLALYGAALVAVSGGLAFWAGRAGAFVPQTDGLGYSALLTDDGGQPISGTHQLGLALWDAASAGMQRCALGPESQTLSAGRFHLQLPAACASAVHERADLWLEVSVDGVSLGRSKLGSVPYALEAAHSSTADDAAGVLAERLSSLEQVRAVSAASPGKPLKLCRGSTTPLDTAWQLEGRALRVTVDISRCGFKARPVILSGLYGTARHERMLGGSNPAPPTGGKDEAQAFDISISDPNNQALDPVAANADGWHVTWAAVGD